VVAPTGISILYASSNNNKGSSKMRVQICKALQLTGHPEDAAADQCAKPALT